MISYDFTHVSIILGNHIDQWNFLYYRCVCNSSLDCCHCRLFATVNEIITLLYDLFSHIVSHFIPRLYVSPIYFLN